MEFDLVTDSFLLIISNKIRQLFASGVEEEILSSKQNFVSQISFICFDYKFVISKNEIIGIIFDHFSQTIFFDVIRFHVCDAHHESPPLLIGTISNGLLTEPSDDVPVLQFQQNQQIPFVSGPAQPLLEECVFVHFENSLRAQRNRVRDSSDFVQNELPLFLFETCIDFRFNKNLPLSKKLPQKLNFI